MNDTLELSYILKQLFEIGYSTVKIEMKINRIVLKSSKIYKGEGYFIVMSIVDSRYNLFFHFNDKKMISMKDASDISKFIAEFQKLIRFHKRKDWDYKIVKEEL